MRQVFNGTLTATSSGVEIPIEANKRTSIDQYLVIVHNPSDATTGEDVFFIEAGVEIGVTSGFATYVGGDVTRKGGDKQTFVHVHAGTNPKLYAAADTVVRVTVRALTHESL